MYTEVIQPRNQKRRILKNISSPNAMRNVISGVIETGLPGTNLSRLNIPRVAGLLVAVIIGECDLDSGCRCYVCFEKCQKLLDLLVGRVNYGRLRY